MLTIGLRGSKPFRLTSEQRSRHIHALGVSGSGKSKFLEFMIRQDILAGRGLCLIDPHGSLADAIVRFCASRRVQDHRRVHIIEPSDTDWSLGFNPLRIDGAEDPMVRVDTMVDTCAAVWGGENIDETPLLATCLQLVFYALATNRLTLAEAIALTQANDVEGFRSAITKHLPDEVYASYWEEVRELPRREREERFSSTRRRLLRFLGKPVVRRMLGQREQVIDLRRVMDEGDILIVNLASKGAISSATARLIGALLTSEFYLAAIGRTEDLGRRHPYYLYIDECYDFLTGDIEKMLDQTRKFGLHLVLAHHRLGQLRARSEAIYNGVMTGAQTKIVFGGLTDEDAEIMAREIMRSSFNLERPKHSMDKPLVVGDELIWLESDGSFSGGSDAASSSKGTSWNNSMGVSTSTGAMFDTTRGFSTAQMQTGMSAFEGTSSTSGSGGSVATGLTHTENWGSSRGRHQSLRSVYRVMPTQLHTLEEEVHLAILQLREQPNQRAIVKIRGQKAKGLAIPHVPQALAHPDDIAAFREGSKRSSRYLSTAADADAEIEARRHMLGLGRNKAPAGEDSFWTVDESV